MVPNLTISIVPSCGARLSKIAKETGRSMENIAASAVEEAALNYFRHRSDDPGRPQKDEEEAREEKS